MPVVPPARRAGTRPRRPRRPPPRGDHPERCARHRRSRPGGQRRGQDPRQHDGGGQPAQRPRGLRLLSRSVQLRPEVPGGATHTGTFTADRTGKGRCEAVYLPNGQYRLTWLTDQARGAGKFKVFKVDCPTSKPTTPLGGPRRAVAASPAARPTRRSPAPRPPGWPPSPGPGVRRPGPPRAAPDHLRRQLRPQEGLLRERGGLRPPNQHPLPPAPGRGRIRPSAFSPAGPKPPIALRVFPRPHTFR